jgi:hypothetical protein
MRPLASQLIILEGIPGSGKTTAADAIQEFLEYWNIPSTFYHEGDLDHPADFEAVACLNLDQYIRLLQTYPEYRDILKQNVFLQDNDAIFHYRKLQETYGYILPEMLISELALYDVYEGLPLESYCRLALQRWQTFTDHIQGLHTLSIMECCLLQNPLTVALARHNAPPQSVVTQVKAVAEVIRPLNPLVIYMSPANIRQVLEYVAFERPIVWQDFVIHYITHQAYGKAHNLHGYEGVIAFNEMRQALELEILPQLDLCVFKVDDPVRDWELSQKKILNFVDHQLGITKQAI